MEKTTTSTNSSYSDRNPKRNTNRMFIVIGILSVIVTVLAVMLFMENKNLKVTTEEKQLIQDEKSGLEKQLNGMILEYDSLRTENDSINSLLSAEQQKIKRLLSKQASDATKIRLYRDELTTLRKVMRSYIVQIDSLNTRNRELTDENIMVRTQLRSTQEDRDNLAQQKENLSQVVTKASVLNAKNIIPEGLNKNSKPKDRVKSVDKIRVCFTIRENAVAKPGTRTIYLRILRPDNIVLTSGETDLITIDGQELVFTAKRDLEYENKDIDMCIFWDRTEDLVAGTYTVYLYSEGFQIGSETFSLR